MTAERLRNIGTLATPRAGRAQGALEIVRDAEIVWEGDRIVWAGAARDLPARYREARAHDAGGRLVVPGLVDCHTHLAFGGWRADEFVERQLGRSYLEIARAGGGILRTVRDTRGAGEDVLLERASRHLAAMSALGVTTVEAKSGYGLDLATELQLLRIYRTLGECQPVRVVPTLLAAHAVPPEFATDREGYVACVCDTIVPAAAAERLAVFGDVFVEAGAFTPDDARRIVAAGRAAGLRAKLHVDQLHDGGGARLAAEVGAISADHLEHVSSDGIAALAAAGVVAVSLPVAALSLQQPPLPARAMLAAGVPVAVATDFNPGTAPVNHLPLAMTLACLTQRMTPAEVLDGATLVAARAIGLESEIGSIEVGKSADFALLDTPSVDQWLYCVRGQRLRGDVRARVARDPVVVTRKRVAVSGFSRTTSSPPRRGPAPGASRRAPAPEAARIQRLRRRRTPCRRSRAD